jgi:hypothetical protein
LRQDLQDEQDELRHTDLSSNGEALFLMPHPLFHPVNPDNPVKIQFFNCIDPANFSQMVGTRVVGSPAPIGKSETFTVL